MPTPQSENGSAHRPTLREVLRWARELERGRLEVFASLPPEEILPGPGAAARGFSADDARDFAKAFHEYEQQYQQQLRDSLPPFAVPGEGARAANDNAVARARPMPANDNAVARRATDNLPSNTEVATPDSAIASAAGQGMQAGAQAGQQASRAVGQAGQAGAQAGEAAGMGRTGPINPLARLPVMDNAPGAAPEENRATTAGGREPRAKSYLNEKARDVKDMASTFIGVGGAESAGMNPLLMAQMLKKYASLPPRVLVSATVLEIKKIMAVDIWDWYGVIYVPVYAWINFEFNDYIRSTATLAKSFLREAPPSFKKMVPPQVMGYIQLNLMTVEEQHMFHWLDWFAATVVWSIIILIIFVIIGVIVKIIDNPLEALGAAGASIVGFVVPAR
ncbi:MAG: hypothetical protein PHT12_03985 [Patescibacteria group bacterium]|nr:hypothetical protein [Patescibacteria group bacterium]